MGANSRAKTVGKNFFVFFHTQIIIYFSREQNLSESWFKETLNSI